MHDGNFMYEVVEFCHLSVIYEGRNFVYEGRSSMNEVGEFNVLKKEFHVF